VQKLDEERAFRDHKPSTDDDKQFVKAVKACVEQWYSAAVAPTLEVAVGVNSGRRSLAFSALESMCLGEAGWRGFYYQNNGSRGTEAAIVVTRATASEAKAHDAQVRLDKIAAIKVRSDCVFSGRWQVPEWVCFLVVRHIWKTGPTNDECWT
jgi:hypothetical protein